MTRTKRRKKCANASLPIKAAKDVAERYGQEQVILLTWDGALARCTYGTTVGSALQAAQGGDKLKMYLGWPESTMGQLPERVLAIQRENDALKERVRTLVSAGQRVVDDWDTDVPDYNPSVELLRSAIENAPTSQAEENEYQEEVGRSQEAHRRPNETDSLAVDDGSRRRPIHGSLLLRGLAPSGPCVGCHGFLPGVPGQWWLRCVGRLRQGPRRRAMKDPVRVLGLVLLLVIFLGVSYWFVQGELESQEHFTRECRARGGVAITQVSGTRICVSGQEIVIP